MRILLSVQSALARRWHLGVVIGQADRAAGASRHDSREGERFDSGPLASAAYDSMIATRPWMSRFNTEQQARTREDLVFIIRFIAAARLVKDSTVLMEFLDWLDSLLSARGVPTTALVAGLEALEPLVDHADPMAGLLIRDALRHVPDNGPEHRTPTRGSWWS